MPVYTRKGDKGETCRCGGAKVGKEHICIEVCGYVDELNSFVGLARSHFHSSDITDVLKRIQRELFELGADLSSPLTSSSKVKRITPEHTKALEASIAQFEKELKPLHNFILPAGTPPATTLHICRSVCRRAERRVVAFSKKEKVNGECMVYLNRLSSLFFEMARAVNRRAGVNEEEWKG